MIAGRSQRDLVCDRVAQRVKELLRDVAALPGVVVVAVAVVMTMAAVVVALAVEEVVVVIGWQLQREWTAHATSSPVYWYW